MAMISTPKTRRKRRPRRVPGGLVLLAVTGGVLGLSGGVVRGDSPIGIAHGRSAEGQSWRLAGSPDRASDLCLHLVAVHRVRGGRVRDRLEDCGYGVPPAMLGTSGLVECPVGETFLFGPAAPGVIAVRILLSGGDSVKAALYPAPAGLGFPGGIYLAIVPNARRAPRPTAAQALDAQGNLLDSAPLHLKRACPGR